MANFRKALEHTLGIEGGVSNHPYDSGGLTKWGITIGAYAAYKGRSVSADELKNMTEMERDDIYQTKYWDVMKLDLVNDDRIGTMVFDQGVNSGNATAIKRVQKVLNKAFGFSLSVDGKNGPNTSGAVNKVDPEDFMTEFMIESELYYNAIIKGNTSQLVFINGWTNRRARLWRLITNGLDLMPRMGQDPTTPIKESESKWNFTNIMGAIAKALEALFNQKPKDEDPVAEDAILAKIMKNNPNLPSAAVARSLSFLDNPHVKNKSNMIFVDFTRNSKLKRFYFVDLETGKAEAHQVAHGKKSDPDHDGNIDSVSNISGSNKSSKGAMYTGVSYGKVGGGYSKFNYAVQLHGLEPGINDKVDDRAVVFHNSDYVSDIEGSLPGRSLGCFAVSNEVAKKLTSMVAGGMLLYAHY